jgi:hypothetical protein
VSLVKLDQTVGTIVIGNPKVVDATLQGRNDAILFTAKKIHRKRRNKPDRSKRVGQRNIQRHDRRGIAGRHEDRNPQQRQSRRPSRILGLSLHADLRTRRGQAGNISAQPGDIGGYFDAGGRHARRGFNWFGRFVGRQHSAVLIAQDRLRVKASLGKRPRSTDVRGWVPSNAVPYEGAGTSRGGRQHVVRGGRMAGQFLCTIRTVHLMPQKSARL